MDKNRRLENNEEKMTYEEFKDLPKHGSETPTVILQLLEERPMRAVELAEKLNGIGREIGSGIGREIELAEKWIATTIGYYIF